MFAGTSWFVSFHFSLNSLHCLGGRQGQQNHPSHADREYQNSSPCFTARRPNRIAKTATMPIAAMLGTEINPKLTTAPTMEPAILPQIILIRFSSGSGCFMFKSPYVGIEDSISVVASSPVSWGRAITPRDRGDIAHGSQAGFCGEYGLNGIECDRAGRNVPIDAAMNA